jgi:hypothetical protein
MMVKIKIKNELKGSQFFFVGGLYWNEKITLTKEKKSKEWGLNWKKIIHHKLWLKDEIKNQ